MKYLLDTHIFLWVIFDEKKLSEKAKEIIKDLDKKDVELVKKEQNQ